jgi:hypothetical protein
MSDLPQQISGLVDEFVTKVAGLARQAAMNALNGALGAPSAAGGGVASRGGRKASSGGQSSAPAAIARRGATAGKPGAKRPAEEMARIKDQVLQYVTANPGKRVEHIKVDLGHATKDLALPIKKLIAEGAIKSQGEKRATAYFPGGGKRSKKAA